MRSDRTRRASAPERRGKDRLSLHAVVAEYLGAKQPELRPTTLTKIRSYLTGAYFRPLHGKPLDGITRAEIAAASSPSSANVAR